MNNEQRCVGSRCSEVGFSEEVDEASVARLWCLFKRVQAFGQLADVVTMGGVDEDIGLSSMDVLIDEPVNEGVFLR